MPESILSGRNFRPLAGITLIALASVIMYTWAFVEPVRMVWDNIDRSVFYALNGTLAQPGAWQTFWAVGNNIAADIFMGSIVAFLFYRFAARDGGTYAIERLCTFLVLGTLVFALKYCMRFLSDGKRPSASAELEPAIFLSQHVDWLKVKDMSNDSFPSDHASLLILATFTLWFYAGKRMGLTMAAVAVFFCLPRLFSGAHWFTDMAVGSLSAAMVVCALAYCTPVHKLLLDAYLALFDRPVFRRLLPFVGLADRP